MDPRLGLALKYYGQGLPDAAWHTVQDLARAADAPREALHLAAVLCLETGHDDEALTFAARLIEGQGADADAHLLRGQALRQLGRFDEAHAAFAQAGALNAPPPILHFNLGLLHHRAGRLSEAEQAYRASLAHQPDQASAWNNLGLLYDEVGRAGEAQQAFEQAIALEPSNSVTHNNLGATLAGQGHYVAAARAHERALELDPHNIAARINLGVAQLEQGALDAARRTLDAALAQGPRNREAAGNRLYLDIYVETDPAKICKHHEAWGQEFHHLVPAAPQSANKPLKVGYVSADFRRHSVSFFIEELLRHHDPQNVEVHAFSDVAQADEVTARLKALVPHWHDVGGWDDERLRAAIREIGIDVLVDLAGHTGGNRLSVFARRAAPVQVSALGYPATTGVASMDYRLCDAVTDPPGSEAYSTEELMRLHALHCFAPPPQAPAVGPLPMLSRGFVTFGSFNKLAKVSDLTVAFWAGVLNDIPGARLVLKTKPLVEEETRAAVRRRFAAHGVDPARLDLRGWAPGDADHLAAYGEIDIALDTFPYNGTTTTCEALWMGVPVVSLAGKGHASRVGASVLTSAGLRDWCGGTEKDARAIAAKAVAAPRMLAELRSGLRERVRGSRLCDGLAYARDIESAFRTMWGETR